MSETVSTGVLAAPIGGISAARLRLAVFVAIAGFMIAGPAAEQLFGLKTTLFRSWIMFSTPGLGVIDASFSIRRPDGTLSPLDRFELLGVSRSGWLKRIDDRDELALVIKRLCAAAGPDADIRVSARRAIRSGWRIVHAGTQNVCAG